MVDGGGGVGLAGRTVSDLMDDTGVEKLGVGLPEEASGRRAEEDGREMLQTARREIKEAQESFKVCPPTHIMPDSTSRWIPTAHPILFRVGRFRCERYVCRFRATDDAA